MAGRAAQRRQRRRQQQCAPDRPTHCHRSTSGLITSHRSSPQPAATAQEGLRRPAPPMAVPAASMKVLRMSRQAGCGGRAPPPPPLPPLRRPASRRRCAAAALAAPRVLAAASSGGQQQPGERPGVLLSGLCLCHRRMEGLTTRTHLHTLQARRSWSVRCACWEWRWLLP